MRDEDVAESKAVQGRSAIQNISNPTSKMNGTTAQKTLVPWCIYSLSFLH